MSISLPAVTESLDAFKLLKNVGLFPEITDKRRGKTFPSSDNSPDPYAKMNRRPAVGFGLPEVMLPGK